MKLFYFDKKKLTFERIKPKNYLIALSIITVLVVTSWSSNVSFISKIVNKTDTLKVHTRPFTEDALVDLLEDCNMKYPYIVLAQAKLESGNFTSKVFKQNNNMFGMRKARQRITSAMGEKNTYAYYRDWIDCVYDYAMYQSSVMCKVSNESEYFAKLGERYAEDSTYTSKLKEIIKREKLKTMFED